MLNIKNTLSRFKENFRNKGTTIKNNVRNSVQKFKENFSEAKSKSRSKRKSLFLGFTIVLSIFGVTLLTPVVAAVAKDIPKNGPGGPGPKPGELCPAPAPAPKSPLIPSEQITQPQLSVR